MHQSKFIIITEIVIMKFITQRWDNWVGRTQLIKPLHYLIKPSNSDRYSTTTIKKLYTNNCYIILIYTFHWHLILLLCRYHVVKILNKLDCLTQNRQYFQTTMIKVSYVILQSFIYIVALFRIDKCSELIGYSTLNGYAALTLRFRAARSQVNLNQHINHHSCR